MRLYWEVAVRGFHRYATYRAATLAGVITNTIFGFMRAYVFIAVFANRGPIGGFDRTDTVTYTFLTQGLIMVVYMWNWWEIALTIRSGDVVTDLSRPLDYEFYWLAQDLGRAVFHATFRGIPPMLFAAFFFHLRLPQQPITWIAFVVSILLATCVSFALRFCLNLSAFWLLDYRGIGAIAQAFWTFFSGFAVPVAFFPSALQSVTRALPFVALINTPVEIFLEKDQGIALAGALLFQPAWAVALLAAGRLLLRGALRKVVIQGG